jgi:hypothetical protein
MRGGRPVSTDTSTAPRSSRQRDPHGATGRVLAGVGEALLDPHAGLTRFLDQRAHVCKGRLRPLRAAASPSLSSNGSPVARSRLTTSRSSPSAAWALALITPAA